MAALSALRTELGVKLRDQNNRILTSAQMNVLFNNALDEWCSRTEELRQENAYSFTAKEFDIAGPTNMLKAIAAYWTPTRTWLDVVNQSEFVRIGGYDHIGSGIPYALLVEGPSNAPRLRVYPAAPATSATTTLNGAVGSTTATSITVAATSSFRSPSGWVLIDTEKVLYQNTSSTQLLLCRRGVGQTTAATHSDGATVTQLDLHLIYARQPTALSADTDAPEINARFHRFLVWHALATALRLDGRDAQADRAEAKWEQCIAEGKSAVKRTLGASPAVVLDSGY